jgi:hypothetical protein
MNASSLGLSNTTVLLNGFRDALTPASLRWCMQGQSQRGCRGAQAPYPPRTQFEAKRKEEEVRGERRKKKREEEK